MVLSVSKFRAVMLVFQPLHSPPLTRWLGAVRMHRCDSAGATLCTMWLLFIGTLAKPGQRRGLRAAAGSAAVDGTGAADGSAELVNCTSASVAATQACC